MRINLPGGNAERGMWHTGSRGKKPLVTLSRRIDDTTMVLKETGRGGRGLDSSGSAQGPAAGSRELGYLAFGLHTKQSMWVSNYWLFSRTFARQSDLIN